MGHSKKIAFEIVTPYRAHPAGIGGPSAADLVPLIVLCYPPYGLTMPPDVLGLSAKPLSVNPAPFHVGLVQGGTSVNTVAARATAAIDVRFPTLNILEKALGEVREICTCCEIPGSDSRILRAGNFCRWTGRGVPGATRWCRRAQAPGADDARHRGEVKNPSLRRRRNNIPPFQRAAEWIADAAFSLDARATDGCSQRVAVLGVVGADFCHIFTGDPDRRARADRG
jgi:Peptidase dimerisation domain